MRHATTDPFDSKILDFYLREQGIFYTTGSCTSSLSTLLNFFMQICKMSHIFHNL